MQVGAFSSTGVVALLGLMAGVCAMVFVIAVCITFYSRHNRVQSKDSSTDGDYSPTKSKSPKNWISLSSKRLLSMKKGKRTSAEDDLLAYDLHFAEGDEPNSPVWQHTILMGERCQPPAFSGLILYDESGNRIPEFPCRSPQGTLGPPSFLQLPVN